MVLDNEEKVYIKVVVLDDIYNSVIETLLFAIVLELKYLIHQIGRVNSICSTVTCECIVVG